MCIKVTMVIRLIRIVTIIRARLTWLGFLICLYLFSFCYSGLNPQSPWKTVVYELLELLGLQGLRRLLGLLQLLALLELLWLFGLLWIILEVKYMRMTLIMRISLLTLTILLTLTSLLMQAILLTLTSLLMQTILIKDIRALWIDANFYFIRSRWKPRSETTPCL